MIIGQEQPDCGHIRIGETVKLSYVDQSRDVLDPEKTIWEVIQRRAGCYPARQPGGQFTGLCGAV